MTKQELQKAKMTELFIKLLSLEGTATVKTYSGYTFTADTSDCYILEPLLYMNHATISTRPEEEQDYLINLSDIAELRVN